MEPAQVDLTLQYLRSSVGQLERIPQLRLHLHTTISHLRPSAQLPKIDCGPSRCRYCYAPVDHNRDIFTVERVRESLRLNVQCHVCRRVSHVLISKPEQITPKEDDSPKLEQTKKKKKSKKDKSAGLNIPNSLHPKSEGQARRNKEESRKRLQHLLSASTESKKGSLQDFLQKIK